MYDVLDIEKTEADVQVLMSLNIFEQKAENAWVNQNINKCIYTIVFVKNIKHKQTKTNTKGYFRDN